VRVCVHVCLPSVCHTYLRSVKSFLLTRTHYMMYIWEAFEGTFLLLSFSRVLSSSLLSFSPRHFMMNFLSHTYVFVVVKQMTKIIHDVHAISDVNVDEGGRGRLVGGRVRGHTVVKPESSVDGTFEWHISQKCRKKQKTPLCE
jgi:hypothetical protein